MFIKAVISLSRTQKAWILLSIDLALVPVAFFITLFLQQSGTWPLLSKPSEYLAVLPYLVLTTAALTTLFGLDKRKLRDYDGEALMQTIAVAALLGLSSGLLAKLTQARLPFGFHVELALVYFAGFVLARQAIMRLVVELYRHSGALSRVAIYGAGRTGLALANELRKSNDLIVCAFFDDNATLAGMTMNGVPIHSGVHAAKVKELYKIDRVILAMPSVSADKQTFLSKRLEKIGLPVQSLPAFTQIYGGDALLGKLAPIGPAALLRRNPLTEELSHGCDVYRGENILISGAGGSIGLELCRQIIACRPAKLVLLELSELALYNADAEMRVLAEAVGVEIVPVLGSIGDEILVAQVLQRQQIDVVLHAAAYKHVPLVEANLRVGLANNTLGTAVIAGAAARAGVKRFVLVSSDKAVRPGNLMGASKRLAEMIVQDLAERAPRTIFSIVRFGNVLGSSGSVVPLFQEQIARGGPVTLTDEGVTRYFMTIQEASRLVLLAGSFAEGGEVYVLDMGAPIRIGELARRLIAASGYTVRDGANPNGDIEIVTTGLRPGEKLHEELMVRRGAQATAHPKIIRVREDHLSELETAAALRDLRTAVERGAEVDVIAAVAHAVREYAPQSLPAAALQCQIVQARRAVERPAE